MTNGPKIGGRKEDGRTMIDHEKRARCSIFHHITTSSSVVKSNSRFCRASSDTKLFIISGWADEMFHFAGNSERILKQVFCVLIGFAFNL